MTVRGRFRIRALEESLEDFRATWAAVQEGHPVPRRAGKSLTSLEVARRILTPRRLELLRAVRREQPESLSRLARLLGRDLKHVRDDVETLARYGLVVMRKRQALSGREVSMPMVPFTEIELRIAV
jgi:predicted transcriptional regulator